MTPRAPHQPVMMIEGICNAISVAFVPVHEEAFENAHLVILITICNDLLSTHVVMKSLSVTCYVWITLTAISLVFNE